MMNKPTKVWTTTAHHSLLTLPLVSKKRPLSSSVRRDIATPMNDELNYPAPDPFLSSTDLIVSSDLHPKPYPPESPLIATSTGPRRKNSEDKKATRQSQYRSSSTTTSNSLSLSVSEGIAMKSPRGTLIVRNSDSADLDVGVPLMGKATRESLKARAMSNGATIV